MVEKNNVGLGLEIMGRRAAEDEEEYMEGTREREEEEELELGLTLGKKKASARGAKAATWRQPRSRIPSLTSRASPGSSSTSSVSSSSATNLRVGARTKRAAADSISDEPFRRPPNPPNSQEVVVGWPPIGTFRMNSKVDCSKEIAAVAARCQEDEDEKKIGQCSNNQLAKRETRKRRSLSHFFVKVYMEGDPIGRKVDLSAHHSYEDLALKLELMFCKRPTMDHHAISTKDMTKALKMLDESSEFVLTYEDRDGDWMLLGDVPWRMFLDTVKRLRIMRI